MRHSHLAAALISLAAVTPAPAPAAETEPARAISILRDGADRQVGTATLVQDLHGVRIAIGVKGLKPGVHAFNLHEVGRCDAPAFTSAGGHFNPGKKAHGAAGAPASHAGDLPDLVVGADGAAMTGFIAKGVSLTGGAAALLGGAGTALVLEAGGVRVACGVVTPR